MGNGARYSQVVPSNHFWTDLEQLLEFFKHQEISKEYLLTGLKNTKKNGYDIQELKKLDEQYSPSFIDVDNMIEYVKDYYDKKTFIESLKNTILNGFDLMEKKVIFKIPVNNIKEEDIEDYIRNVAIQFKINIPMKRQEIYKRIDVERDYQDLRWSPRREKNNTPDEQKPPAEWLNYIEFHLSKAKEKVYMLEDEQALAEIRKVAALAVRCLELHGCPERIIPKDLK